jgi:hypothetical protein
LENNHNSAGDMVTFRLAEEAPISNLLGRWHSQTHWGNTAYRTRAALRFVEHWCSPSYHSVDFPLLRTPRLIRTFLIHPTKIKFLGFIQTFQSLDFEESPWLTFQDRRRNPSPSFHCSSIPCPWLDSVGIFCQKAPYHYLPANEDI